VRSNEVVMWCGGCGKFFGASEVRCQVLCEVGWKDVGAASEVEWPAVYGAADTGSLPS